MTAFLNPDSRLVNYAEPAQLQCKLLMHRPIGHYRPISVTVKSIPIIALDR